MSYPTEITMYQTFEKSALARGSAPALWYYGTTLSYLELKKLMNECAAAMLANGVQPGDRVVICAPNIPQTIAAIYAVNQIGAIASMLHPLSAKAEVAHAVNLTGAKFAFCFDVSEKGFDGMDLTLVKCRTATYFENAPAGWLRTIGYRLKIRGKTAPAAVKKSIEWTDFIQEGKDYIAKHGEVPTAADPKATAAIMFTGGTTGLPKGVMLTNSSINHLSYELFDVIDDNIDPDKDAMLTSLPVFHGFGFALCMHVSMCAGIAQAIFPTFDAKTCSKAIIKHKLNFIFGVPAFFEKIYKAGYLKGQDMSYVKLIGSGGDVVPSTLTKQMDELLKENNCPVHFVTGYGLTECVTVCTFTDPSRVAKPSCIGIPCLNVEAMTVKMGTTQQVQGEDGELCIYAPTLMQGYWEDPEETAKVLVKHEDGRVWLHTGDMCYIDDIGDIYYRQRIKRVLKISGYLVYPSFIEETMRKCEAVDDCCVVGVGPEGKTSVKLYVVPKHKPAGEDAEQELTQKIIQFGNSNLSKWSVPKNVEYLHALPRTKIGKVDFKALEAQNR